MTKSDPLDLLFEEINALHRAAGEPSYERIKAYANIDGRRISTSSMSNLAKRTTKPRLDTVLGFVTGCEGYASSRRTELPAGVCHPARWTKMVEAAAGKSGTGGDAAAGSQPSLGENFLSQLAWGKVHQLISTLPSPVGEDHVRRLLWAAVDDIGPLAFEGPCRLESVLRALDTGFVPAGSLSPALVLLEYLAATQHVAVRQRIRLLVDELAASTGVPVSEVNQIRTRAAEPFAEVDPVSLFVKVDGDSELGYHVTAWLYRPDKPLTFKYEADGCYSVAQLRVAVEALIAAIAPIARGISLTQLQFEFALPWNLLAHAVEQWRLSDGRPIGTVSRVVVRSVDRMQDPWAAAQWQRRSRLLPRCDLGAEELVVEGTVGQGNYDLREQTVCLAAHGPYLAPLNWQDDDPLLAAIKDGLPSALWYRDGGDRHQLVDLVYDTVMKGGPVLLPAALQRFRSAHRSGAASASSICLLFDDFYQQPEPLAGLSWPSRGAEGEDA
ncbi:hypothetical protein AB0M47_05175 [Hamadaea sp. NPDC051192]|uniref:VMAP-C domain-containing protein n=1 Tax=Hamadaea sp. NPDC051192 TaxID=3154940 RepID=UPI0034477A58